jgi:hypothetical protein
VIVAVLSSLFAATMLACLGAALALLGSSGTMLAMHDSQAAAAAYAAQAALSLASAELRARADWSGVVMAGVPAETCAATGAFVDPSLLPRAPWDGSTLDLQALSTQRQVDSDAAAPAGVTGPVWRLFEYGPISRLVPSEPRRYQMYVAVWAAGGPGGLVLLYATALGTGGVRASAETSIRPAEGGAGPVRQATRTVP